jgi:hypothetical protein
MHGLNRRHFLYASAAAAGLAATRAAAQQQQETAPQPRSADGGSLQSSASLPKPGERKGKFLERDGARIFYQTFGEGDPMLLLHGYPLSGALFARATEVPTLVLVGLEDQVYPTEIAMMMQSAIKGSKLHVVPDAAHAAIFEKADDAASAIASWAAGGATGSVSK